MGLCMKASCTVNNLCGKCRKLYPSTAASNDRARRERRGGGGRVARGIAAAGMIGAIGGAATNPQQSDTTSQKQWGDSSLRAEGTRQARSARGGTRDRGNQTGGSSQRG